MKNEVRKYEGNDVSDMRNKLKIGEIILWRNIRKVESCYSELHALDCLQVLSDCLVCLQHLLCIKDINTPFQMSLVIYWEC